MKFYLSSYRIGNKAADLKKLVLGKGVLGFIPNALDYVETGAREESNSARLQELLDLGIEAELLDLKNYFRKKEELQKKINSLAGVWVRGGNTFVLRQAMKLSGFDEIIVNLSRPDFLYGGYSAGVCILGPSLRSLAIVDDPLIKPYPELAETIWDGLGLLDYTILPHYKSDHPEAALVDKTVEYCIENKIIFKTLKDGEVIIE